MTVVAFIGLGNMGLPMAVNLTKAGHSVNGWDTASGSKEAAEDAGLTFAASQNDSLSGADIVITMLPSGPIARAVYLGSNGVIEQVAPGTLLIDSSTIDVATSRALADAAAERSLDILDAPVSGGVTGAQAAGLTFMVGGSGVAFDRASGLLNSMGKTIVHAGDAGAGQAAKICNNMILGASMIAVSEAFALADGLGLDRQRLFDIASKSSGQCWSLTSYCPVAGPVPTAPSNRGYQPGFAAAMMLKDLNLAKAAAQQAGVEISIGQLATDLYERFCEQGNADVDFSGIFNMVAGKP